MWYKLKRIMMRPNGVEKQVRPSTPIWNWDLTKATLASSVSVTWYLIYGVAMSDDGTKFYYATNNWNSTAATFHQFTLTTPFDISTRTNEVTFDFGSSSATWWVYPFNIVFRENWEYLYLSYLNSGAPLYWEKYTLSTPRDVSTSTLSQQISLISGPTNGSLYISNDGTKMWTLGTGIYYKDLSTPFTLEAWTLIDNWTYPFGTFSSDWKYVYTDNWNTIAQYSLTTPRDITTASQIATLTKTSGSYWYWIYFNRDGTKLRTVRWSVNGQNIYTYEIS